MSQFFLTVCLPHHARCFFLPPFFRKAFSRFFSASCLAAVGSELVFWDDEAFVVCLFCALFFNIFFFAVAFFGAFLSQGTKHEEEADEAGLGLIRDRVRNRRPLQGVMNV